MTWLYTRSKLLKMLRTIVAIVTFSHLGQSFHHRIRPPTSLRLFGMMDLFKKSTPFNDTPFEDRAPSWTELDCLIRSKENILERISFEDISRGRGPPNHKASLRLFDAPDTYEPEIILYRDAAAWCPYCEKVWLQLEEKKIPYKVEKAPLRCYGEKPQSFLRIQPNGVLPVANVKGRVISESNDILQAIEDLFPEYTPLLPQKDNVKSTRVNDLLKLERRVFSTWLSWLTSNRGDSMRIEMDTILKTVDERLSDFGGPYFLGTDLTIVDIMFTPFLERMAASLPYFKGFLVRCDTYPNLQRWYDAMDSREAYRGIKSDYYTHCHDLPPQIGNCYSTPMAKPFMAEIDGGAWDINIPAISCMEPMIPVDRDEACRDAARNIISNHEALVRFAGRAEAISNWKQVSAPLADPNAIPNEIYRDVIDSALRHICQVMLLGVDNIELSSGFPTVPVTNCLKYVRDRVGVPRDMSVHGARMFRAHINWLIFRLLSS